MSDPGYFQGFDGYGIPAIFYGLPDGERREVLTLDQFEPEDHDYWPDLVNAFVGTPEPIGYAVVEVEDDGRYVTWIRELWTLLEPARKSVAELAADFPNRRHRVVELRPIPEGEQR